MGGLNLSVLLSSFGIGLKGNILFSYFIIALFFKHRFSGQHSFSGGDGIVLVGEDAGDDGVVLGGGGYLPGEDVRGGRGVGGG